MLIVAKLYEYNTISYYIYYIDRYKVYKAHKFISLAPISGKSEMCTMYRYAKYFHSPPFYLSRTTPAVYDCIYILLYIRDSF